MDSTVVHPMAIYDDSDYSDFIKNLKKPRNCSHTHHDLGTDTSSSNKEEKGWISRATNKVVALVSGTETPAQKESVPESVELDRGNVEFEDELLTKYNKDELREFRMVFEVFDTDHNGSITKDELGRAMARMGMPTTPAELEKLVSEVDVDGNGIIDFGEFCLVLKRMKKIVRSNDDVIRSCWDVFDVDGNGIVSKAEFRSVFKTFQGDMSDDNIDSIFLETDRDRNGFIDYDEFSNMVKIYLLDEDE